MAMRTGRRWLVRIAVGFGVVLALWAGLCYQVVENPTLNQPTNADAIVVLGPASNARVAEATRLLAAGHSHQLVISGGNERGYPHALALCLHPPAGVTVTCFDPQPGTTRGEGLEVRRLAAARSWSTIIVVTSKFHISRARLIIGRCFSGRLEMVSDQQHISAAEWAYQYGYQSAGYVKAFLHPSC